MPAGQPFTALCRAAARPHQSGRADLHLHTTSSDGAYTPEQIVDLAVRSGLAAISIVDHDTLAGVRPAQMAAAGSGVEVVPGVEITAEHEGREFHLLAYFVRLDDSPLLAALGRLRAYRVLRFAEMVERLRACGVDLEQEKLHQYAENGSPGRRHLAELLVRARRVRSIREAFARYLSDQGKIAVPKLRLPIAEAISVVRNAGGVAGWAHPTYDCSQERLIELRRHGLGAVEVYYPGHSSARLRQLQAWASAAGLTVTGGSDCHGPGPARRAVGACSVTAQELDQLRHRASR